jgi:hypothetical protein
MIVPRLKFKSDEFKTESEVRFYKFGPAHKWRASREGNIVMPYEEIQLPNTPMTVDLFCGPNRDPHLAQLSLMSFVMAAREHKTAWEFNVGSYGSGYRAS